jgi:Icc-related predicted phosphoesterase
MKIAVCSDLHLEFGPIVFENKDNVDVLILSGDIFVERDLMDRDPTGILDFRKSNMIHEFFYNCCNVFPFVVYVAGNHEHYHGDYAHTLKEIKRKLKYLPNLQVLDKEHWDLHDEYRFIGGTLWTDMNKEDPLTLHSMTSRMNDFRCVTNSNRQVYSRVPIYEKDENGNYVMETVGHNHTRMKEIGMKMKEAPARFSPEDAVVDHKEMLKVLRDTLESTPDHMKVIVVGHHAPSKASTHPRYADETIMNGGYSSDLSEFILDNPNIKLWTHGHTHEDFDYMIGSTRIVCNPRGYIGYEERADRFELKVVEV